MCIKCDCKSVNNLIPVSVSQTLYLYPSTNIHLFHSNVKVNQTLCDNANGTEAWSAKLIQYDEDFKRLNFFALFLQHTFMFKTYITGLPSVCPNLKFIAG